VADTNRLLGNDPYRCLHLVGIREGSIRNIGVNRVSTNNVVTGEMPIFRQQRCFFWLA